MASVTRAIHLVVGLVAVSLVADAARTKASLEPAIVAGLSSTLQVKVANVCTEDVVKTGCEAIAFSHDGRASSAGIAAVLDVKMADADAFLVALGFPGDTSGGFDCRAFCEASVAAISDVLGEEIPPAAGVACLVPSCEHTVDVSDEALQKEGLGTPEEHQQESERDQMEMETNVTTSDTTVAPTPHTTPKDLLRRALNVFFQAFPAPEDATEDSAEESLLEDDPSFGPVITRHRESRERRRKFTAYIQKASAWVASALRKLETPQAQRLMIKVFRMHESFSPLYQSHVDRQITKTRQLLAPFSQALQNLHVQRGADDVVQGCNVCPSGGSAATVAFVLTYSRRGSPKPWGEFSGKRQHGRDVINICEFYWCRHGSEGSLVGTFVHEVSHLYGTTDKDSHGDSTYPHTPNWGSIKYHEASEIAAVYQQFIVDLMGAH